jgi:hypothetical protein
LRDYIPSPQRRAPINLLPEPSVGVDLVRRGDWVREAPHTYFYVNWRAKVPNIWCRVRVKALEPLPGMAVPALDSLGSRSHDAVIRVYDAAGNVIETHEQSGDFKEA